MGRTALVYALVDPRDQRIRYVGKTLRKYPNGRMAEHLREATKTDRHTHKLCWIRQLVSEGYRPELVVLDTVPEDVLEEKEREWIARLKERGEDLTNTQEGGQGGWDHLTLTPEQLHERALKSARNRPHEIYVRMGKKGGLKNKGTKKPGTSKAQYARFANMTEEQRIEFSRKMSEIQHRRWEKISPEERSSFIKNKVVRGKNVIV